MVAGNMVIGTKQKTPGLAQVAYQRIRDDIIRCQFDPAQLVSRAYLVDHYGFGEAAVREALNRLSQEQLVRALPREGYQIASVTLKQVQDLFEARLVVEPAVTRLAVDRVDIAELRALDQRHWQAFNWRNRAQLESFVASNAAFHLAIARGSGNDRLLKMMSDLVDEMKRVMVLSYLASSRNHGSDPSHAAVIDALATGDGELAAVTMAAQLERNRAFVLESLLTSPSLQRVNISATPP
jgi:DNA-binding GntR family transcriptional regulator